MPLVYTARIASGLAGLILALGAIWFIDGATTSAASLVQLVTGISGIGASLLPTKHLRQTSDAWPWVVCAVLAMLNGTIAAWGVWKEGYATEELRWPAINLVSVTLLLAMAMSVAYLRSRKVGT